MTLKELSKKYFVSVPTLRHWIKIGRINCINLGPSRQAGKSQFTAGVMVDEEKFKQYYRKVITWDLVRNLYDLPEEL